MAEHQYLLKVTASNIAKLFLNEVHVALNFSFL